jgi:hypothetical protein
MFPGRAVVALAPRGTLLRLNVADKRLWWLPFRGGFRSAFFENHTDDFTY